MINLDRARGCLLGLAIGDATGTSVEFLDRGDFEPVTDMVGGGAFNLQPGQWTDDTSLALCLAESLIQKGFDPTDQITRYVNWYRQGYMSCTGDCFDIGGTTRYALECFEQGGGAFSGPIDDIYSGNGSLMRLAPIPIMFPDYHNAVKYSGMQSATTHGSIACIQSCEFFGEVRDKVLIVTPLIKSKYSKFPDIANLEYMNKTMDQIHGTGHVIKSLEASLWCFMTTNSFGEAVLAATNLGDDADTTAAITGQIAGAYYGLSGIPKHWVERVAWSNQIQEMADKLVERGSK